MGKYSTHQTPPRPRPYDVHPIWRGIGCIIVLVGPPIALVIGHLLVDENSRNNWMRMPRDLMGAFRVPGIDIVIPHLYATLMAGVLVIMFGAAFLMIIYSVVYGIMGPKRIHDVPPEEPRRPKKRR